MSDAVADPFMADSAADVPGKLLLGQWAVYLHEWADRDEIDPATWRARVRAACEENDVPCEFVVIDEKSLTVVFHRVNVPDFDMVRQSIEAMLVKRWKEESIPSEGEHRARRK